MLRFMENHDEQRIASPDFAGNPWLAVPGMIVTATLKHRAGNDLLRSGSWRTCQAAEGLAATMAAARYLITGACPNIRNG
jgi:hypothetical protein